MSAPIAPKRVLVIGGGAAGLATLRNLLEVGEFDHVQLVERRDEVGGVWYLDEPDPSSDKPRWPSPAYPKLIGNVLPHFLSFSKYPFPLPAQHPDQPFPTLSETQDYLLRFAEPLRSHIRLNTEVLDVEELPEGNWKVKLRDHSNVEPHDSEALWDAVVVCVCWYDNPAWPTVEGLDVLRELGLARHAKWWRGPQGREGAKVLVIGNANSSNDIAAQLAPVVSAPVYRSIQHPAFPGFPSLPDDRIKDVASVRKYTLHPDRKISVALTDGTEIHDLDFVEIGTGYRPRPSFVRVLDPSTRTVVRSIVDDEVVPYRVPSLHRLILYAHNPSLAFIGITLSYTPFVTTDLASIWLSLAWRGEIFYPATAEERLVSEQERLEAINQIRAEWGNSSLVSYGVLGATEQAYATGLRDDIVGARKEFDGILMHWKDEDVAAREGMFKTKRHALEWTKEQKLKANIPV